MSDDGPAYSDDIAPFRQPMVTSIGIVMGFLLAFMANWAVAESGERALQDAVDWLVAGTILISVGLMVLVLYRLLDNRMRQNPGARYQGTFRLYIAAIVTGLVGLTLALVI